jgi:predicted RNA binding protein YcfA (HicA-like mRNA interferase family)
MPKVPRIAGDKAVGAFCKAGYQVDRQKGSHCILKHPDKTIRLSILVHAGRILGRGLLRRLIKDADLTVEQFREYT